MLTIALSKGRILDQTLPLLEKAESVSQRVRAVGSSADTYITATMEFMRESESRQR